MQKSQNKTKTNLSQQLIIFQSIDYYYCCRRNRRR